MTDWPPSRRSSVAVCCRYRPVGLCTGTDTEVNSAVLLPDASISSLIKLCPARCFRLAQSSRWNAGP